MSNIKKNIPLGVTVLGALMGFIFVNHYDFGLCYRDLNQNIFDVGCSNLFEQLGDPLFYGMSALAVIFLALLLVPRAYGAWKKFATWFVPLAALLFIFYLGPGSGDLFSPDPELVFKWVSILYVAVSVGIIASVCLKGKK